MTKTELEQRAQEAQARQERRELKRQLKILMHKKAKSVHKGGNNDEDEWEGWSEVDHGPEKRRSHRLFMYMQHKNVFENPAILQKK